MAAEPADTTSPASATSSPATSSRRTPRRLFRRGRPARVSPPAPGDLPEVLVEDGLDCASARCGAAGGLPDSGLLSPSSSRIVTTESYGLSARPGSRAG